MYMYVTLHVSLYVCNDWRVTIHVIMHVTLQDHAYDYACDIPVMMHVTLHVMTSALRDR